MSNPQDTNPSRSPESYDPDYTEPVAESDSDNPIAEQRSKREDPNEEGRPAQAIADDERKRESAEYSGMEAAEPVPASSPGDLDNTPVYDFGQPGTPVKDIANGLAEEPDLPDLPKDHPAYLIVERERLRRTARDAEIDPAVLGS